MTKVATMPAPFVKPGPRIDHHPPGKLAPEQPTIPTTCAHARTVPVFGPKPGYRLNPPMIALGKECLDCGGFTERTLNSCVECSGSMNPKGIQMLYEELVSLRECSECGHQEGFPIGKRLLDPSA